MGSPAASRIENTGSIHSSSSTIAPRRTNMSEGGFDAANPAFATPAANVSPHADTSVRVGGVRIDAVRTAACRVLERENVSHFVRQRPRAPYADAHPTGSLPSTSNDPPWWATTPW